MPPAKGEQIRVLREEPLSSPTNDTGLGPRLPDQEEALYLLGVPNSLTVPGPSCPQARVGSRASEPLTAEASGPISRVAPITLELAKSPGALPSR
jgi:hypothetical protein